MTPAFAELEADSIRKLDAYRQRIADLNAAEAVIAARGERLRTAEQRLDQMGSVAVRPIGGEAARQARAARRRNRSRRGA